MKILVMGDFHGKFPKNLKQEAKKADLILCTGDFGGSEKLLKIIFNYLGKKWWEQISLEKAKKYLLEDYNSGKKIIYELDKLNKPFFIIPGNWDFTSRSIIERNVGLKFKLYQEIVKKSRNLHWWNRGVKKIDNLKIIVFGGIVTAGAYLYKNKVFSEKQRKKFIQKNKKETEQLIKYGEKDVDLLLAHYPPYGFFDKVNYKGENPMNGKHVGFKGYTLFIKKYSPKIFICGHMHEYQGMKKFGKTKIIKTGAAKDGKGVILEIENKKIKEIKFIN